MPNYQNFEELRTSLERMRARMGTAQDALQTAEYQLHMLVTEISPLDRVLASEILEQVSGIEQANFHTDLEDFIEEHGEPEPEPKIKEEFLGYSLILPDQEPDLSGPRKDYADPMEDEAYVDHLIQEQEEREFTEEQEREWEELKATDELELTIAAKSDVAMKAWRDRERILGEKSEYWNPREGRIISPMLTNNGWIALEQAAVDAWVLEQENLAAQAAKARQEQEDQEQEHTELGQAVLAARIRNRIIQEDAELMRRLRSVLRDILNI